MIFGKRSWLPGLSLLALVGCSGDDQAVDQPRPLIEPGSFQGRVVATVNEEPVPEEVFQAYLRMSGKIDADASAQQAALKELTDLLLLAQDARANGLLDRASTRAELVVQRLSWVANQSISRYAEANPVTDEEIAAEYERQVQRTGRQEYRLRHILAPSREEADSLILRLGAGENFTDVEREQVERLGAAAAGEIDWVNLAQVPAAFGPAVSELGEGEFTRIPVQSEYGWHVILLEGVRPFDPPALEAVRDGIRATLARRKIETYLAGLRVGRAGSADSP